MSANFLKYQSMTSIASSTRITLWKYFIRSYWIARNALLSACAHNEWNENETAINDLAWNVWQRHQSCISKRRRRIEEDRACVYTQTHLEIRYAWVHLFDRRLRVVSFRFIVGWLATFYSLSHTHRQTHTLSLYFIKRAILCAN